VRSSLFLTLLVATLVAMPACKRRGREVSPSPSVAIAEARSAQAVSTPVPLPFGSAIVPSPTAFADGGAPGGYENATVWDLVPAGDGAAVLLLDSSHTTVLPIFVGGTEALTIRLNLDGKHYDRPLTHDLLASIVRELGGQPIKAQIDELRDDTYFGSIFVRQGDRVLQLDARPSDAIAIALGSGAPLYVSRSVMLTAGMPREDLEKEQRERASGKRKTPISL
jgi:bifunctional DNase/RNase